MQDTLVYHVMFLHKTRCISLEKLQPNLSCSYIDMYMYLMGDMSAYSIVFLYRPGDT